MIEPTLNFLDCKDGGNGHRMAYWEWGDPQADHTVFCVHGLSRQGRDFDVFAEALLERALKPMRIICPDVVGRGRSDWLQDPNGYQVPTYAADMMALLMHLKITKLDWVGTSMGGLIGMAMAVHAKAVGAKVRRLVLNDVGPGINWDAVQRMLEYLGRPVQYDSVQHAAEAMWAYSSSFGPHTPDQWFALSRHMVKVMADGMTGFIPHYDPAIAVPLRAATPESAVQAEAILWALYDSITTPTLLLRGEHSDVLSPSDAKKMTQRGPKPRLVEFGGVGHAPSLIAPDQIEAVASFLLE